MKGRERRKRACKLAKPALLPSVPQVPRRKQQKESAVRGKNPGEPAQSVSHTLGNKGSHCDNSDSDTTLVYNLEEDKIAHHSCGSISPYSLKSSTYSLLTMSDDERDLGSVERLRSRAEASDPMTHVAPAQVEALTSALPGNSIADLISLLRGVQGAGSGGSGPSDAVRRAERAEDRLDRKIKELAPYKEGVNMISYITMLEQDLRTLHCPKERYKEVLLSKLTSSKLINCLATIPRDTISYDDLVKIVVVEAGNTKIAMGSELAELFRSNHPEDSNKAYQKLKVLADSILLTNSTREDMLLFIITAALRETRSSKVKSDIKYKDIKSFADLQDAAASVHSEEQSYNTRSTHYNSRSSSVPCQICKKFGHTAVDCRYRVPVESNTSQNSSSSVPTGSSRGRPQGIVCFTCNTPGHKSPDCPNRNGSGGDPNKTVVVKKNRKVHNTNWVAVLDGASHVVGEVNGFECQIVPDTGAEITIVPASVVYQDQLLPEYVSVRGWRGQPMDLQKAKVDFKIKGETFTCEVAVAHEDDVCNRVLFSVPMDGQLAVRLLLDAASSASQCTEAGHSGDTPDIHPSASVEAGSDVIPQEASKTSPGSDVTQESLETLVITRQNTDTSIVKKKRSRPRRRKNKPVDSVVVDNSDEGGFMRLADIDLVVDEGAAEADSSSVASVSESVSYGDGLGVVPGSDMDDVQVSHSKVSESSSPDFNTSAVSNPPPNIISHSVIPTSTDKYVVVDTLPADEQVVSMSECPENSTPRQDVVDSPDLVFPIINSDNSVENLISEVNSDDSLEPMRRLAKDNLRGYAYNENGVLTHTITSPQDTLCTRIVLPLPRRRAALVLAHDKTAHVGVRGMRKLIGSRFVWPGIHGDIVKFVKTCDVCLCMNSSGNKQALMVPRPILSQPFESVAVDLVGPLPKGRRGCKYIFTYICLSSRWPEAIPMRTASAKEAAQALLDIISRTGFPLRILSDRGTIFMSNLMTDLHTLLGIDSVQTSPYRPQSNGVVERLHGTLKPMLAKAQEEGMDWVEFLPLALYAIRQVPNRDTGFSPHMLVFGREMAGPLDLMYQGWVEKSIENVQIDDWLLKLSDQLSLVHDLASANESKATETRIATYNRGKCDRQLDVGDQVLLRIPGMHASLQASWDGPYKVVSKVSRVTYRVSKGADHPIRLAHINNLKNYSERPKCVFAATLMAEDTGIDATLLHPSPLLGPDKCVDFNQKQLNDTLTSMSNAFSNNPGLCTTVKCHITIADNVVPVSQQGRNIPVGIEQAVKNEISKLLDLGIILPSEALWSSPLVPVRKKDGSVRICVDFRQLNAVTPLVRYWVPSLDEILQKVGNSVCLSTLDLTAGFHQIAMDEKSSELTTFVCPLGKYRYARMPFGLKNAPAIFQAAVESVLSPVKDISCNYIDDVVIFSPDWKSHLAHLKSVITTLHTAGFTIKLKKCCFGRRYLTYLGHRIGGGGVSIPQCRVESLTSFRLPITKKDLRSFLGAMGYYRRFIPGFGSLSALLTPSVSLRAPHRVVWTSEMEEAVSKIKQMLCNHVVLCIPRKEDVYTLYTDASGDGIGACLHVTRDGEELPVAFFSRQLRPSEKNYTVTELESLAIVAALQHFERLLYALPVTIVTDHKACLALTTGRGLNKRLLRFALLLQDRPVSIVHRAGREITNADGFSRQAWTDQGSSAVPQVSA